MVEFAVSAVLVWLAINIAFVVLRLRAIGDAAALRMERPSHSYPEAIRVRHRAGR